MIQTDVRISFVVITRNRPRDLADCLRSCRRQQWPNKEILVVDNHSTDHTLAMLANDFPDVRVVALDENRGVSGGRNAGILEATGEYCIAIDDDAEFIGVDVAGRIAKYFDSGPDLACVGFTIRDATTRQEEGKSIPRRDKLSLPEDYEATYFCGAGFAVRRRSFLDLGMFWDPLVYGSQEIDLSYRFLEAGLRIVHSSSIEVLHRSIPTDRPSGQWVYYNTRDRPWVAVRNLPWRFVFTTTILWWANTLAVSMRRGEIGPYLRAIRDCAAGLSGALGTRRVLSRQTARKLKEHSGRYWY